MRHDAVEVVEKMLEDGSLDGIHIFFPDPWHKNVTINAAWVQVPFVEKLLPKLKSGGYVHMATDWEEYAVQMLEVLSSFDALQTRLPITPLRPIIVLKPNLKPEAKRLGSWRLGLGVP